MADTKPIIMVVDDQPDFIEGVKLILESEGYEVWTANNGRDALNDLHTSFKNRRHPTESNHKDGKYLPDLILADIMMPIMDGYGLHEKVRSNPFLSHIPFVFLTAKTEDSDVRHGKELGADDYLAKPCQPDDLLATVRGKLRRTSQRRAMSAQFAGNPNTPSAVGIIIVLTIIFIIIVLTVLITLFIIGG
ncbi:MAG: response regulator [Anaerolineae bacterium]|nr:response regulator [Anaerolineae bacterium]